MRFLKRNKGAEKDNGQTGAAFSQNKNIQQDTSSPTRIPNAGGSIVTKSILSGESRLKWLFRQEGGEGNGWIAFGDTDTQEYVNNPQNLTIVDFNTLIQIEPAAANVYFMPYGSDLEFRQDESGSYFVDTKTGKEIRQPVPHPLKAAFSRNLKFLNQETYPPDFFRSLFLPGKNRNVFSAGIGDFPSGQIVLADPLAYLGTKYQTLLHRTIPAGCYPIQLSVFRSKLAGLRIAAARLILSQSPSVRYEIATTKGTTTKDLGKPGVWTFFGVDTGLACITDLDAATEFKEFSESWNEGNRGKNLYQDYFAPLFQESYRQHPEQQNPGGSFLSWQLPRTDHNLIFFSSGMGDGVYSGYWGLDSHDAPTELIVPFMNPSYF